MSIKGLPKYIRTIDNTRSDAFMAETPDFMEYCNTIMAHANARYDGADEGSFHALSMGPSNENISDFLARVHQAGGLAEANADGEQSATLLAICSKYGRVLTECLGELPAGERERFLGAVTIVSEKLIEAAFTGVFVEGLSDRGRAALIKGGVANIMDYLGKDFSATNPATEGEEPAVFLDICNAYGGLLAKCLGELSADDRDRFLGVVSDVNHSLMVAAFRDALIAGLSIRERTILIRAGVKNILACTGS